MSNYHQQNQAYSYETAPTEHLQQNFGFSPAYEQGGYQAQRVPPYPTSEEYMRQPPTAPYPTLPPLQHQQQQQQPPPPQYVPTHVHVVQPTPQVHVEQPAPRIVYVQPRENSHWCVKLCCECMCAIVSSVIYTVVGIVLFCLFIGLIVYFAKFYNRH